MSTENEDLLLSTFSEQLSNPASHEKVAHKSCLKKVAN